MKVEVDLGSQPPANHLAPQKWQAMVAPKFPLCAVRCPSCSLVQLTEPLLLDLFSQDYPYRQGQSATWVAHLRDFVATLQWQRPAHALDVGANDGALVKILREHCWTAWGVDPAPQGPHVLPGFMGKAWAQTTGLHLMPKPNLITAFNVLAHVPNLDDFLGGVKMLLAPGGQFVVEVPDWEKSTWDTIYHEHLSYFTESTLANCLARRGFHVDDMIAVPTHGGSVRATVTHA